MKKNRMIGIIVLSLALVFAACSTDTAEVPATQSAEGAVPGTQETATPTEAAPDPSDTAAILQRMSEFSEEITSMRADMHLEQDIRMVEGTETTNEAGGPLGIPVQMHMISDMEMEMTMDPLVSHMKIKVQSPGTAESDQFQEVYTTTEGMYTDQYGEWIKITGEGISQDPEEIKESYMSDDAIRTLREMEENLVVTEVGDAYHLSFEGSGEDAEKLLDRQIDRELAGDITLNNLKYLYVVDKQTYKPRSVDMDMDFEMDTEVGRMAVKQQVKGIFSKINEITEIVIPQEILDAPEY